MGRSWCVNQELIGRAVNIGKTENPGFCVFQRRIAFLAVKNIRVFLMKMDRSRRVDIDRMSGRQNRIAGRGVLTSQSRRKTENPEFRIFQGQITF